MITTPTILFGVLLSTLYGAGFFLWRGGDVRRLVLSLILAWSGFWIGHFLGNYLGWTFSSLGGLRLGMATLTAALFLGLGYWLGPQNR